MSSIRQKWSPITQNTYDDKKYRQHIAIITYLLPLGCSCVGCREGCLHACWRQGWDVHLINSVPTQTQLVGIKYENAFLKCFRIWHFYLHFHLHIMFNIINHGPFSDLACVCIFSFCMLFFDQTSKCVECFSNCIVNYDYFVNLNNFFQMIPKFSEIWMKLFEIWINCKFVLSFWLQVNAVIIFLRY